MALCIKCVGNPIMKTGPRIYKWFSETRVVHINHDYGDISSSIITMRGMASIAPVSSNQYLVALSIFTFQEQQ